jgi:hypothetical protein
MSSSQRLVIELSTYFLQAAVVAGGRLVAHREFAPDDAAGLASFVTEHAAGLPLDLALLSPVSSQAEWLSADVPATQRTVTALLARTEAIGGTDARLAACDVTEGRIPKAGAAAGWLVTAISSDDAQAADRQLKGLGLAPKNWAPALPSELGAVVELIRATPGASPLVVWEPGESSARLWKVSGKGIEAVQEAPAGFSQIFDAVHTELGLKFRAAATKLFFNSHYDFGDAADRIGGRVGAILRETLGEAPTTLHVLGLPAGQAWLASAVATSLGATVWAPAPAAAQARYGVSADLLSARVTGLLQAAAAGQVGGPWLPAWITPATVFSATASVIPAPAPAPSPSAAPAPAKPAPLIGAPPKPASKPVPVPAPAAPVAKPVTVGPAPAKPAVTVPAAPTPAAAPVPLEPKAPFPFIPLLVGLVAFVVVVGTIVYIRRPAPKSASTTSAVTPVTRPVQPVAPAPTPAPAPAPGQPAPVVPATVVPATLDGEVRRDPLGFKNQRYQFSVSSKGALTNLVETGRTKPTILNLGFMRLYGISLLPDGRRAARRAGDMFSPDYKATVNKRIRDGVIVFDVNVTHPKFTLTQTYVCLPASLKVEVRFQAKNLTDSQGPLDAIYGVHFSTAELSNPTGKPLQQPGALSYTTQRGQLVLRYGEFKGAGSQPVIGDPALASFVLASAGQPAEQRLDFEIILP